MSNSKFYVVYVDRLSSVSLDELKQKMNLAHSWYRISEKVWILHTSSDVDKWYSRLSPFVKEAGSLFICGLDVSDRQGWMNKKFWDWLRERQTQ